MRPRLLDRRVDWLTLAFQVRFSPLTLRAVERAVELAVKTRSRVPLRIGLLDLAVAARWATPRLAWECGFGHGLIDLGAQGGWTFEAIPNLETRVAHHPSELIMAARAIAKPEAALSPGSDRPRAPGR